MNGEKKKKSGEKQLLVSCRLILEHDRYTQPAATTVNIVRNIIFFFPTFF